MGLKLKACKVSVWKFFFIVINYMSVEYMDGIWVLLGEIFYILFYVINPLVKKLLMMGREWNMS